MSANTEDKSGSGSNDPETKQTEMADATGKKAETNTIDQTVVPSELSNTSNEETPNNFQSISQEDIIKTLEESIQSDLAEHITKIQQLCSEKDLMANQNKNCENAESEEKSSVEHAAILLAHFRDLGVDGISQLLDIVRQAEVNRLVESTEKLLEILKAKSKQEAEEPQEPAQQKEPSPVPAERWPYRDIIKDSAGTMLHCLQLDSRLLQLLAANSVLSEEMVANILCRPNRPDKVRGFISYMLELGPESLTALVQALRETDQHYLANILSTREYY